MRQRKRIILALFTILLCVGFDQITKGIAAERLSRGRELSFAGDVIRFSYSENEGAVFSFEYYLPEKWHGEIAGTASALLVGAIVAFLLFGPGLRPLPVLALSLFCGGSASNLLDRMVFGGNVVDFIIVTGGGFRSWTFNVADAAIVSGLTLLIPSIIQCMLRSGRPGSGVATRRQSPGK